MRHLLTLALPFFFLLPSPVAGQERTRNVAILIFEGVELLDFAGPGEVFAAAGNGAFRVYTVADGEGPVSSMGFLTIVPEFSIDDCPEPDIIVVPGGGVPARNERLQAWVAEHAVNGELTMSVCNGAALLAAAGVLAGLEVTTHHNTFDSVIAFEPTAEALVNRRFVDHGDLITTAGISAGIDGSLQVVARLIGEDAAQATAIYMEYDWRPEEIEELHAKPGIRYEHEADLMLARIAEQGLEAAVADYREARARQSETDRSVPSHRRLRTMGNTLLDQDRTEQALILFEFAAAAHPDSTAAQEDLVRTREIIAVLQGGGEHGFVYTCPPCGGTCDSLEHEEPGSCPQCGMALNRRVAAEPAEASLGEPVSATYVCPPCGADCDALESAEPGTCPECNMTLRLASLFANGSPAISPDGERIAFWSDRTGRRGIFVSNADGSGQRLLSAGLEKSEYAEWSPDGEHLVFNEYGRDESRLWIVEVASGKLTRLPVEGWSLTPAWSPDGERLAFAHGAWPRPIVVSNLEGGEQVALGAELARGCSGPAWSPAGDHVAFTARAPRGMEEADEIWITAPDGSGLRKLTEGRAPAWSPDGELIAFERSVDDRISLFVVQADGSNVKRLTGGLGNDKQPSWSPAGDAIYFESDRDGTWDIYAVNPDGSNARRIIHQSLASAD